MGQIRGTKAKISACNIRSLSSFGIPYAGMHILVSTDNSAMEDGNGNFDAYVVGDGKTAATELPLHYTNGADEEILRASNEALKNGKIYTELLKNKVEQVALSTIPNLTVGNTISSNTSATLYYFRVRSGETFSICPNRISGYVRKGFTKYMPANGVSVTDYTTLGENYDYLLTAPFDGYFVVSLATAGVKSVDVQTIHNNGIGLDISSIVDAISEKEGYTITPTSVFETDKSTIAETAGAASAYASARIPVSEGDRFLIYGTGSSDKKYRMCSFVDANNYRLFRCVQDGDFRTTPYIVEAPTNSAYMIINLRFYDAATDRVLKIGNKIDLNAIKEETNENSQKVQVLNEKVGILNVKTEKNGINTGATLLGKNIDAATRARTTEFVNAPFFLKMKSGYKTYYVFRYALNAVLGDLAVSAYSSVGTELSIDDTNYKYRISFSKDDTTEEFTDAEAVSVADFYDGMLYEIEKIDKRLDALESSNDNGKIYVSTSQNAFIRDYATLISKYDELIANYPNYASKNTLGQTAQGTTIYEYVFSSGSYNKAGVRGTRDATIAKPIFAIQSGVHGYERAAVNSLYVFIRDLLTGNGSLSELLLNAEIHIIPCVCPWGFDNDSRMNANSVNINRNYNANWVLEGEGTNNYSGPSAASELETQISQNWIGSMVNAGAKFVIDWHNSGFTNEIFCLATGAESLTGNTSFKRYFLKHSENAGSLLKSIYGVSEDGLYYTTHDATAGMSGTYIALQSQLGGYIETSWDADGKGANTPSSASIGASVFGNVMLGWLELFGITNDSQSN